MIEELHSIRLCLDSAIIYGCFNAFQSPFLNLTLTSGTTVGLEVQRLNISLNETGIYLFCASTECTMNNPLHTLILSVRLDVTGEYLGQCTFWPFELCILE